MEKFMLGQEVVITGKLVKEYLSAYEVEVMKEQIKETGQPAASKKYSVKKFDKPKFGIVVGTRSIVGSRLHYLDTSFNTPIVSTKTIRQPAVVVATDLRGLYYVPMTMVQDYEEWEFGDLDELDEEFDFDDELDELDDELCEL